MDKTIDEKNLKIYYWFCILSIISTIIIIATIDGDIGLIMAMVSAGLGLSFAA